MDKEILELINNSEKELKDIYQKIDLRTFNKASLVLDSFHEFNVSESDFNSTTGYGYNDVGRDKIEKIFAKILKDP